MFYGYVLGVSEIIFISLRLKRHHLSESNPLKRNFYVKIAFSTEAESN
jgi:hypothetical protein